MDYRILIVGGGAGNEDLKRMLEGSGCPAPWLTEDPAAAPGLVRVHGPDVVLLELDMPGIKTATVVRDILEAGPVAVIAHASYDKVESVKEAEDMGASAYLFRPFNYENLMGVIEMGVSRFRQCLRLHAELGDCKETLRVRKLIERAKGIVMRRNGLTEEDAFLKLQKLSRDSNMKMEKVAESIITASDLI